MASSFPPHPSATTTATAATPASDTARRVVTVLIARRVAPASVAAFEAAMQGMLAAAESFPGHLGGQVIRPEDSDAPSERPSTTDSNEPLLYHVVFAFDNEAHLAAWQDSPERAHWLAQVLPHTVGAQQLHRVTGLDYWFAAPNSTMIDKRSWFKAAPTNKASIGVITVVNDKVVA